MPQFPQLLHTDQLSMVFLPDFLMEMKPNTEGHFAFFFFRTRQGRPVSVDCQSSLKAETFTKLAGPDRTHPQHQEAKEMIRLNVLAGSRGSSGEFPGTKKTGKRREAFYHIQSRWNFWAGLMVGRTQAFQLCPQIL